MSNIGYVLPFSLGGILEVCYELFSLSLFLDAGKDHLGAGNVLFRICQVDIQSFIVPCDTCKDRDEGIFLHWKCYISKVATTWSP